MKKQISTWWFVAGMFAFNAMPIIFGHQLLFLFPAVVCLVAIPVNLIGNHNRKKANAKEAV